MIQIRQTIDVNVPLRSAYDQWTQFEEFPRFMDGVHEVRQLDDARLHWRAYRHGRELEWDSEITDQVPDALIVWRDVGGPGNQGSIRFQSLREDVTRIEMTMDMQPRAVPETSSDSEQAVRQRIAHDLQRFKQLIEQQGYESGAWRGEIHEGHASGMDATSDTKAGRGTAREGRAHEQHTGASQTWLPGLMQAWEERRATMRKLSDDMDQFFERFLGRPMVFRFGQGGLAGKWMPAVEVVQRGDELVVFVELPGLTKDAVKVEIRQGKLFIEGERPQPSPAAVPQGFRRSERSYGPFFRMIPLLESIDASQCKAHMHEGVLEVRFKLLPPDTALGQRIPVDA